jgi:hypothetical protein
MLRDVSNLKIEKFKLKNVIDELIYVYEPNLKFKKIKIINEVKKSSISIETDKEKLF